MNSQEDLSAGSVALSQPGGDAVSGELARLRNIKDQYRLIVDSTKDFAFVLFDKDNRVTGWNEGAERLFGYTVSEIIGRPGEVFFVPEDNVRNVAEKERRTAEKSGSAADDRWHLRKDGSRLWVSGVMRALYDDDGSLRGFLKIVRDLTDQKLAKDALQQSEERFRLFVESVTDYALIQVDTEARVTGWNLGAERMMRYSEAEIVGKPMEVLCTPEDVESDFLKRELDRTVVTGCTEEERWLIRKDGNRFFARWVTTPIRNSEGALRGFAKVMRDETERRRAEERVRASLTEKDALLKEIHHRVKNNLQVIVSLLGIQANMIHDPEALSMFEDTQNRVRAIAAIHETLYSSADLASIHFGSYLRHLVRDLFGFYLGEKEHIGLRLDVADVVLEITQAIPLGLILNELVTNCFKHAFPGGRSGEVSVTLRYVSEDAHLIDDGECQLSVIDNGIGLPEGFALERSDSMGLHLVTILTRQLQGRLELNRDGGTCFLITFPLAMKPEPPL